MKLKNILKTFIDIVLIIFCIILSIKKGGFYKTDSLFFYLVVVLLGSIYIFSYYLKNILEKYIKKRKDNKKEKLYKFDIIEILLFLLTVSYLLPILFNNYSNLSDSIFEMVRYFCIYVVYFIVKRSDNKKMYIKGVLIITLIQCLIGVDGLANRHLENILSMLDSGYLKLNNLSRMSSTIQYANVFSLFCVISSIYLIDKIKEENIKKILSNKLKYSLIFLLVVIYISSIILSQSRIILAVFFIYLVYILVSKIDIKNKALILCSVLFSIIYSNIFMNLLNVNSVYVYFLTVIAYIISFFASLSYLVILDKKFNSKNIHNELNQSMNIDSTKFKKIVEKIINKNNNLKVSLVIFFICVYLILTMFAKIPIKLSSNSNKNDVSRNIYKLNENVENDILVKIKQDKFDTRYKVNFLVVNDKLETSQVESFGYYSSTNDTFEIKYIPKSDFKYLIVNISCQKGSLKITDILVNNKENYIDYLLFPSEILYRIIDFFNGDTSFKERIYYIEDAFKIITRSCTNFFVGVGGEGFKNLYEQVKVANYSSTEVHNVYLQIFVESGIIGLTLFLLILLFSLKNSKNDIAKLLLIIIYITSFFDLNFSYLIVMIMFAILLGIQEKINEKKAQNKILVSTNVVYNCYYILVISFSIVLFVLVIRANIAYYMKVPSINASEITLGKITSSVTLKEKRVMLDLGENAYRKSLLEDYEKYLDILKICIKENNNNEQSIVMLKLEYENVLVNIEENVKKMQNNDRNDVDVLLKVIEILTKYMKELVEFKFFNDKEAGYKYYLDYILCSIEKIDKIKSSSKNDIVYNGYNKLYKYLIELNDTLNSDIIKEYILSIDKKLCNK